MTRVPSRSSSTHGAEPDLDAALGQTFKRRVDESVGQAVASNQRPAGVGALAEGLPQDRGDEFGRRLRRLGVEHGDDERVPEPFEQGARRRHDVGERRAAMPLEHAQDGEIVRRRGARHPPDLVEDPERQAPPARRHAPAFPGVEVEERKPRAAGADKPVLGPDVAQERHCRGVAAHHQVIAVVDHRVEGFFVERPAPAARMPRGFMHRT